MTYWLKLWFHMTIRYMFYDVVARFLSDDNGTFNLINDTFPNANDKITAGNDRIAFSNNNICVGINTF